MKGVSFQSSFNPKLKASFITEQKDKFKFKIRKMKEISDIDNLNIQFHSDEIKNSIRLTEDMFTNFLSRKADPILNDKLIKIIEDPNYIKKSKIDFVSPMTPKLHKCIQQYVLDFNYESEELFKANVMGLYKDSTPIRVYLHFEDLFIDEHSKVHYVLNLILIDPFHLAIPSQHKIGKKHYTKEAMEVRTYNENLSNKKCMSTIIEY